MLHLTRTMKLAVAASDKVLPVGLGSLSRALHGQVRAIWPLGHRTATLSTGSFASSEVVARAPKHTAPSEAVAQQDFADVGYEVESIGEVDWNAQLVNAVSLVGNLGDQLTLRTTGSGSLATGALAVKNSKMAKQPTSWFRIEIWGPLAEVAAKQLHKGNQVQVLGRLRSSEYTDKEGKPRKDITVSVSSISRVRSLYNAPGQAQQDQEWGYSAASQESNPYDEDQTVGVAGWGPPPTQQQQAPPPTPKGTSVADQKWNKYFSDPNSYYDNRFSKTKATQPDFRHKTNRDEALWLNGAPEWVLTELNSESPVAPL